MWKDKGLQLVILSTTGEIAIGNICMYKTGLLRLAKERSSDAMKAIYNIIPHHLYLLSDEEIKEGDTCFDTRPLQYGHIFNCIGFSRSIGYEGWIKNEGGLILGKDQCIKVIASTDPSLNLPSFPQSFLEEYVKIYNSKQELNVEVWLGNGDRPRLINITNQINIRFKEENREPKVSYTPKGEEMYTRKEVEFLLRALNDDKDGIFDCSKWIIENLK